MASSSSLAHFNAFDGRDKGLETIEIDPQYAQSLGFVEGDIVRFTMRIYFSVDGTFFRSRLGYFTTWCLRHLSRPNR